MPPTRKRMNAGIVLEDNGQFGGVCSAKKVGKKTRCDFKPTGASSSKKSRHTCDEDIVQRWECALHRLSLWVIQEVQDRQRHNRAPMVYPERVLYNDLAKEIIQNMEWEENQPPPMPVHRALDYPNPRTYWGDDGRGFLITIAESMFSPMGRRVFSDAQVEEMKDLSLNQ